MMSKGQKINSILQSIKFHPDTNVQLFARRPDMATIHKENRDAVVQDEERTCHFSSNSPSGLRGRQLQEGGLDSEQQIALSYFRS